MAICKMLRTSLLLTLTLAPFQFVDAKSYYVSTSGNNSQSGSRNQPLKTISRALSKISAGDTIIILDGEYNESLVIKQSGTPENYISIIAESPGQVTINAGNSGKPALVIREQSYIKVDGLKFTNSSDTSTVALSSRDGQSRNYLPTNNIILSNLSIQGSCINSNCSAFGIARASDISLSNISVYGYGRYTFLIYGSSNVVADKVVLRFDGWDGEKYKKNDPRFALGIYNSVDNKLTNLVIMDGRGRPKNTRGDLGGIKIAGGNNGKTAPWISSDQNVIDGFIITDTHGAAVNIESRQEPHKGNTIKNGFIVNNDGGIILNKQVKDTTFDSLYIINNKHISIANFSHRAVGTRIVNSKVDSNIGNKGITGKGKIELVDTIHSRDNSASAKKSAFYSNMLTSLNNWPNSDAIKRDMCNQTLLSIVKRLKNEIPKFCESDKQFADYLISRIP